MLMRQEEILGRIKQMEAALKGMQKDQKGMQKDLALLRLLRSGEHDCLVRTSSQSESWLT